MTEYDKDVVGWIFLWAIAALIEKDKLDERIEVLESGIKQWKEKRRTRNLSKED